MTFKQSLPILLVCLALAFGFVQCNDPIADGGEGDALVFSTDTLSFDTLFTTLGSTTQIFSVRNPYAQNLIIEKIELAGQNTCFRLNVDGLAGNSQSEIELRAHDSIFIFVEATIDPTNENSPVLIEDSIAFTVKGKKSHVLLQAYGQDVHIIHDSIFKTGTLHSDKPYLILSSLIVDTNQTLTIDKGATLYFHKYAGLAVYGNILVNGTVDEPVIFRGDRLDEIWEGNKYDYHPSAWVGIIFYPGGQPSVFKNAFIRNTMVGIWTWEFNLVVPTKIELYNTIIHNSSLCSIYAANMDIVAHNCQFSNSADVNVFLMGGRAQFIHSTLANYYNIDAKRVEQPCLVLANYFEDEYRTKYAIPLEKAEFINCIVDGSFNSEVAFLDTIGFQFNVLFKNSSLRIRKSVVDSYPGSFDSCILNDSTKFLKLNRWDFDFSLDTLSRMRDKADPTVIAQFPNMEFDIRGNSRLADGKPDLGAYEFILGKEEKSTILFNQKKNRKP